MKYLKSFLTLVVFLSFLAPAITFGASYPASCPAEARAIVDAVGGCSTIDPGQYSSIYEKCCSIDTKPVLEPSSELIIEDPIDPITEELPEDIPDTSYTAMLVGIIFFGGLVYLVIWFIRKRKKKKGPTSAIPQKKCPYCKEVIPGDATRCSHCQANLRNWPRRHLILTVIIALVSLILLMGLFS